MPRRKMTPTESKAFVKRMAAGKARKNKGGSSRLKNPSYLKKINWGDTAKNLGGVAGGAFVGYAVADFIGDLLISKLPSSVQGLGYALGGAGIIIAGHILQKEAKGWPITPAAVAIAAPFALRTFASYNVLPLGVAETTSGGPAAKGDGTVAGMGFLGFGRRRKAAGRKKCYQIPMQGSFAPNPMQGSFAPNPMQGNMGGSMLYGDPMQGSIQPSVQVPTGRGGHGSTL